MTKKQFIELKIGDTIMQAKGQHWHDNLYYKKTIAPNEMFYGEIININSEFDCVDIKTLSPNAFKGDILYHIKYRDIDLYGANPLEIK